MKKKRLIKKTIRKKESCVDKIKQEFQNTEANNENKKHLTFNNYY